MNKKILKLGTLLIFILSCSVSTNNSNVDEKPTNTSFSSNISVSTTATSSVEINPSSIPSPTTTPNPNVSSFSYTFTPEHISDFFELNNKNDGIENGYDGKVLIIIDTHLLKEYILDSEDLVKIPREVMILKECYDELNEEEREQLIKEYDKYTIFDRNTYVPIINARRKDSTYDGIVGFNILGLKVNFSRVFIYKNIYYNWENNTKDLFYGVNFSEEIKFVQENLKKSNKRKLMKAPIKKNSL